MYPLPLSSSERFRFDDFELDAQSGELHQRGKRIPLQEIPFRFLQALLEQPGEVLSREQLRDRIWPQNINIDFDASFDTAVRKVRLALGDSAKAPTYIETLQGRGYRFLKEVRADSGNPWPASHGDRSSQAPIVWLRNERRQAALKPRPLSLLAIMSGLMLVTVTALCFLWKSGRPVSRDSRSPHRPSVLVLPASVAASPDMAYFSDALPSALSTFLACADGLDIKLPPTSLEAEKARGDLGKITELYRTEYLVHTNVVIQGKRMTVDLQLAESTSRKVLWASHKEGTREGYLELVQEAAKGIQETLIPRGTPIVVTRLATPEVELNLAEGRHFSHRYWQLGQEADFKLGFEAFTRASALAPSLGAAHAGMAVLFNDRYWKTRELSALRSAQASAAKALELDPRSGPAWMVKSWMETNRPINDPEKTLEYALKAACFAPMDPRIQQGFGSVASGSNGILIATGRRSLELDPLDLGGYSWTALGLICNGKPAEGLAILERSLRLEPTHAFNQFLKRLALFKMGLKDETHHIWAPEYDDDLLQSMMDGNIPDARKLIAAKLVQWRMNKTSGAMDWQNRAVFVAPFLVRLGMEEDALWLLQRSVESKNPPPYDWLRSTPDLQPLYRYPGFSKVLSSSRDLAVLCVKHMDAARARGELPPYLEQPLRELREIVSQPLHDSS